MIDGLMWELVLIGIHDMASVYAIIIWNLTDRSTELFNAHAKEFFLQISEF